MTLEDLEFVIVRSGHARYRDLVADNHPDRSYWRGEVARRAAELRGESPQDRPAPARAPRATYDASLVVASVRRCPYRGRILPPRDGCGCSELWPCAARRGTLDGGAVARTADCTACVRAGGPPAAIPRE